MSHGANYNQLQVTEPRIGVEIHVCEFFRFYWDSFLRVDHVGYYDD